MRTKRVSTAVQQAIEAHGLTHEVRIGALADVIRCTHVARSRTVTRTGKGEDAREVVSETESTPRAQDVVRAVALLDRVDGSDADRQAMSRAKVGVIRELSKRMLRELSPRGGKHAMDSAEQAGEQVQAEADVVEGEGV